MLLRYWVGLALLMLAGVFTFAAIAIGVMAWSLIAAAGALTPALVCVVLGCWMWWEAIRHTSGDDIFSGDRGLLVSLMLVGLIAVAGMTLYLAVSRDTWRGFAEGWNK
jgi:Zn-dependent protease with chaperone function